MTDETMTSLYNGENLKKRCDRLAVRCARETSRIFINYKFIKRNN